MLTVNDKLAWLLAVTLGGVYLLPMAFDALLGIALLVLLVRHTELHGPARRMFSDPLYLCVLVLLLYLGASVFWSAEITVKSVAQLWLRMLFVLVFVLGLAVSQYQTSETLLRACRAVVIAALVCAVISMVNFYLDPSHEGRLEGLFRFDNPGRIGRMFAAALLFALVLMQLDRGRWRWLGGVSFIACSVALMLSGTRSAWLAAMVGIACYALISWRPNLDKALAMTCVGMALVVLLLVYLVTAHPQAFDQLFPRGDSFRLSIWQANLRDIMDGHFWFGWGQLVEHWVEAEGQRFRGPHNMFLAILAAGGIPALVMFCVILGWTGLRLARRVREPAAALGLVLLVAGVAAHLFNGDRIIDKVNFVWFVLWVPVGFALAASLTPVETSKR